MEATPKLILPDDRPPFFVGAGVIKTAEQIETYAAIPEIAVQVLGSYSYDEHGGNDPTGKLNVTYWDEENQAFYNAVGLKNPGREAAGVFLPESIKKIKAAGQLAVISITSLYYEDPQKVLPDLAEWALNQGADGIEINGACPNEKGPKVMCNDVIRTIGTVDIVRRRIGQEPYLMLKYAPMGKTDIHHYKLLKPNADGVTVINNCRREAPINLRAKRSWIDVNDGFAGESGPAIAGLGRQQLKLWRDSTVGDAEFKPDVWSIGGIDNGYEAYLRVHRLGAFAAGGAQKFYRSEDPSQTAHWWAKEYHRMVASAEKINGSW